MRNSIVIAAVAAATLGMAAPAGAQGDRYPQGPAGAVSPGDNVVHSSPETRAAAGNKNNNSQDGTSTAGGSSLGGTQSTESQALGAAAGGSTGGAKSPGR